MARPVRSCPSEDSPPWRILPAIGNTAEKSGNSHWEREDLLAQGRSRQPIEQVPFLIDTTRISFLRRPIVFDHGKPMEHSDLRNAAASPRKQKPGFVTARESVKELPIVTLATPRWKGEGVYCGRCGAMISCPCRLEHGQEARGAHQVMGRPLLLAVFDVRPVGLELEVGAIVQVVAILAPLAWLVWASSFGDNHGLSQLRLQGGVAARFRRHVAPPGPWHDSQPTPTRFGVSFSPRKPLL